MYALNEITPEVLGKILYLYTHSGERKIIIESEEQLNEECQKIEARETRK